MAKFTIERTKQKVELDNSHYLADGGEGTIYVKKDLVYKICKPGMMIPRKKIDELKVLTLKNIIKPQDIILDEHNMPVGYTMDLVPKAVPLAQIISKTYRERESVTPLHMNELVKQIRNGIQHIHDKGLLQVDGNEFNYMISDDYKNVHFIDVNSFQTPSYPALAIMLSIRDYQVTTNWTKESDWFSFSIIAFNMFIGIHPYKQRHPNFNTKHFLEEQMRAGISILDPLSTYPVAAVYSPFENYIPGGASGAYMQWFKSIFIDKKRLAPPQDFQDVAAAIVHKIKEIIGSNQFNIQEIREFDDIITGYYVQNTKEVICTKQYVYVNGVQKVRPTKKSRVAFSGNDTPFLVSLENGLISIINIETNTSLKFSEPADSLMYTSGRIYYKNGVRIYEISFINDTMAISKTIANVMENSTQLFNGVVIQDIFGVKFVSIFPRAGEHIQIRIPELNNSKIIDAKYESNVMMIINNDGQEYHRYVIKLNREEYQIRKIENVVPSGTNFTVSEKGVCVSITEEEKVEIFRNSFGPDINLISDPAIMGDMHLCHNGSKIMFARGKKLYSIAVK